jgi:hypothetical protein
MIILRDYRKTYEACRQRDKRSELICTHARFDSNEEREKPQRSSSEGKTGTQNRCQNCNAYGEQW